ncbi:MAG: L,D-transpeptidase [Provencibacterium sp.]|jgi:lipoprotein-anchoring transpeptidase ErfK/SrfK|nr:L,D-transpeptidase [Provencibacterium sp.]
MAKNRRPYVRTGYRRRKRRELTVLLLCLLAIATTAGLCVWLFKEPSKEETDIADMPSVSASSSSSSSQAEEPPPDPRQQAYQAALALAERNCTGSAPQMTDPATWEEEGRALMERLAAEATYAEMGMTLSAKEGYPYLLAVNRAASTVTVFAEDDDGLYVKPYQAMVCSGGPDTPLGYWSTPVNYDWRLLVGPSYGQYATRIWDAYLFHSVPYYVQHKDDIEYDEYNKLGTLASLGCIRLEVVDVKWIYDNCPIGTPVVIYDDEENPGPMGKPGTIYTDPEDEERRGWDPTDPDPVNPWEETYRSGTAIRSEEAWADYEAAVETGAWNQSVTPTVLQGWSTDSAVAGTRG